MPLEVAISGVSPSSQQALLFWEYLIPHPVPREESQAAMCVYRGQVLMQMLPPRRLSQHTHLKYSPPTPYSVLCIEMILSAIILLSYVPFLPFQWGVYLGYCCVPSTENSIWHAVRTQQSITQQMTTPAWPERSREKAVSKAKQFTTFLPEFGAVVLTCGRSACRVAIFWLLGQRKKNPDDERRRHVWKARETWSHSLLGPAVFQPWTA